MVVHETRFLLCVSGQYGVKPLFGGGGIDRICSMNTILGMQRNNVQKPETNHRIVGRYKMIEKRAYLMNLVLTLEYLEAPSLGSNVKLTLRALMYCNGKVLSVFSLRDLFTISGAKMRIRMFYIDGPNCTLTLKPISTPTTEGRPNSRAATLFSVVKGCVVLRHGIE